jgi:hypothetical protein
VTFTVRKGALVVASGLEAGAVQGAVDAARNAGHRGAIEVRRDSDGALVVSGDAGAWVTEEEWRAAFRARYGSRGLVDRRPVPAVPPPPPPRPVPPPRIPFRVARGRARTFSPQPGKGLAGFEARRARAAETERRVLEAEAAGRAPWRDAKPFDPSKTRRTG